MIKHPSNYSLKHYIGRFAPSPSGPLHIGSLITALASYLDAKHHHGTWLVRMEDIDPPREEAGAQQRILQSLRLHGLYWDGEIMYQSQRLEAYADSLKTIKHHTYSCQCSRTRLMTLHGVYDGYCSKNPVPQHSAVMTSTRVSTNALDSSQLFEVEHYDDLFQGQQSQSLKNDIGDFILRRKDGLFAYQLAVVTDDIAQGITHIIRGSDLLSSTPRQRYLLQLLQTTKQASNIKEASPPIPFPTYGHIPVANNNLGQKLSKQHKAQPIDDNTAFDNLCFAFKFLQHQPPTEILHRKNIEALLMWGIEYWQRKKIPKKLSFVVESQ